MGPCEGARHQWHRKRRGAEDDARSERCSEQEEDAPSQTSATRRARARAQQEEKMGAKKKKGDEEAAKEEGTGDERRRRRGSSMSGLRTRVWARARARHRLVSLPAVERVARRASRTRTRLGRARTGATFEVQRPPKRSKGKPRLAFERLARQGSLELELASRGSVLLEVLTTCRRRSMRSCAAALESPNE